MYQQHRNEVPTEATRGMYQERMLAAYPFHPMLIDSLYLRWSSHSEFQRTRGVLRLLASLIGDLWQRRHTATQSQPLIQPCHVRWTVDAWHAALTRLWGGAYESVAAADVTGEMANATLLDDERGGDYRTEAITQGVAVAAVGNGKLTLGEHLQAAWRHIVEEEEWVLRKVGSVTLQRVGLVLTEGGMRVKEAIEAFLRYTDKPMIASHAAVLEGLKQACKDRLIGIGRGLTQANLP